MTRGKDFIKNAKCTHGHRLAMSNSALCDLSQNCIVLKFHVICHSPNCKCQKQITFSPGQFQLESGGFKSTLKKKFKGSQTAWNKFLKQAVNTMAPVIGMTLWAKTKNKQVGAGTTI